MERPTCATCPYFNKDQRRCHYNPATVVIEPQDAFDCDTRSVFPEAHPDSFCGRHPDFHAYSLTYQQSMALAKCVCGHEERGLVISRCRDCPSQVCKQCGVHYMTGLSCKVCSARLEKEREAVEHRYKEIRRAKKEKEKREARNAKRRLQRSLAKKGKR